MPASLPPVCISFAPHGAAGAAKPIARLELAAVYSPQPDRLLICAAGQVIGRLFGGGHLLTTTWREIPITTYICERMLGFSVPQEGAVLVVSYEGMHLVHLGPPVTVETDN